LISQDADKLSKLAIFLDVILWGAEHLIFVQQAATVFSFFDLDLDFILFLIRPGS